MDEQRKAFVHDMAIMQTQKYINDKSLSLDKDDDIQKAFEQYTTFYNKLFDEVVAEPKM